jgi:tyrosine-specific transport protein
MTIFAQLGGNSFQVANSLAYVGNPKILVVALPMLITTFGYHIIIPSLKYYLQEEVAPLKQAILIGGTIPLVVYVVWQLMVLLLMPIFDNSGNFVNQSIMDNNPADIIINYLMADGERKVILYALVTFLFCALTSSLLGGSLALKDFLADGLKIVKNTRGKIFLTGLTFVPPVLYSILFPNGFLKALGFAGASCSVLSIIYPAFMAWKLRRKKLPFHPNITDNRVYKVKLSNPQIMLICWFGIAVVVIEVVINLI